MRSSGCSPGCRPGSGLLRYWEEFSEAEAAEVLGCSVGSVKSAASRGLARLRELSEPWRDAKIGLLEDGPP